jgi:hypothetical protein
MVLAVAALAAACSTAPPAEPPPAPPPVASTATLSVTQGIRVIATFALPVGFVPITGRPPMWLQNGLEIGVAGSQEGHIKVLGFGGPAWRNARVLAAETGDQAAEQGSILDVAASPDGLTLAIAVVPNGTRRLDIIIRDLIATGSGSTIASFDGNFDSATMAWLNTTTIALALRAHAGQPPLPAPPPDPDVPGPPPSAPEPADGLQMIVVSGVGSVESVKLDCPMSPLSWSPNGMFAIAQGDDTVAPFLIDRQEGTCRKFIAPGPIRILGWAHGADNTFLYVGPDSTHRAIGVFKFDLTTNTGSIVAVSSGAAAYTSSGTLVAAGNQKLTFRMVAENPEMRFATELAIQDPQQGETNLKQLGFDTTPELMAESTMVFSRASDEAAMQIYAPDTSGGGTIRKILTYVVQRDNAFLVAQGPAKGIALLSWSLRGRWLAILDSDGTSSTLSVLQPPL